MPITEECSVVKVRGKTAVIELVRGPKCDGCKACAFNKRDKIRLCAHAEVSCKEGDRVVVEMPQKSVPASYVVLFLIPLVFIFIAVLATVGAEWYVQVAAVAVALLSGLALTVACDRLIKRNPIYLPTVKSVIENTDIIGEDYD